MLKNKSFTSSKEKVETIEISDNQIAPEMIIDFDETSKPKPPSAPEMFSEIKSTKNTLLNFTHEYLELSNKSNFEIYNSNPSNLFNNYTDKLKKYYNTTIQKKIDRTRKKRVIFIHDSFMSNRSKYNI